MKKFIIIGVWILLLSGLIVLMGFVERQHESLECGTLEINIKYNSQDHFITVADINTFFSNKGIKIKGEPLYEIDAGEIEEALLTIPYIEKADVYVSIQGDIIINIIQRMPIVKVYNKYGQCYYIDDKGRLIPQSENYTARLVVANGFVNESYNLYTKLDVKDSTSKDTMVMRTSAYRVFKMAQFLNSNEFWKAMIEEIFINSKGEIELYTKLGEQSIMFGNINDIEEKFGNLLAFYKQGLNKIGWDKYKSINLKYKNQVVCSKK